MRAAVAFVVEHSSRAPHGLLALGAAIVALAVFASPALADRPYVCQITGESSPSPSECNGTGNTVPGGGFQSPYGLAIDNFGNLWVADAHPGGGLDKFSAGGSFLEQSSGTPWSGNYIYGVSFRNASSQLFVGDSNQDDVWVVNSNGSYAGLDLKGPWGGGCCYLFTAADNSGGSTDGDVYVSSSAPESSVTRIDGSGTTVPFSATATYIEGAQLIGTPEHGFGYPWGVATDPSGNIYVLDQGKHEVDEFAPSGTFLQKFSGEGTPDEPFGTLVALAIDPTSGNVLVADDGQHVIHEFDSGGAFAGDVSGEATPTGAFGPIHGLAVDGGGRVYISDAENRVVDVFDTGVVLPKVTYGAVTNQTQTSGTLNANVDPNGGGPITACHFEYGLTPAYSSGSIPCTPNPASSPPGSNFTIPTDVSAAVSSLTTETSYHYRVVVSNANGIRKGADQTFLPHAVAGLTTEPASSVERNTATLNASFNGNGEDTHYYFEWGTSPTYGHATAPPPGEDAESPIVPKELHFALTGLTVETTYHYRVVASNNAGTSYGADQAFATLPAVKDLTTEPASEITASTATLNASYTGINEDVHYYFEWGPTAAYGNVSAPSPGTDDGVKSGHRTLSFPLGQLAINHPIHYRIVASDAAGITHGADRLFFTLGRYEFSTYYGSGGTGDGQFSNPQDLAVDEATGDIYVADTGNHRIVRLNSAGNFISAWGWGVSDGNAASEVCTSGCQAGVPGNGAGQFTTPRYIEVDNSGGASEGDVYVGDAGDSVIQKFGAAGNLITSWGTGGAIDRSHNGAINGITVDSSGDLFEVGGDAPYFWTEYGQDGLFQGETATEAYFGLGTPGGGGIEVDSGGGWYEAQQEEVGDEFGVRFRNPAGVLYSGHSVQTPGNAGLAIDRSVNDLYVDAGGSIEQFSGAVPLGCASSTGGGLSGTGCPSTDTFGVGDLTSAKGLAFDSATGIVYAANAGANNLALFHPLPVANVTTGPVTNRAPEGGTMNGELDPNGPGTITSCYFQYGTDLNYGLGTVPCSPGAPLSSQTGVTAELTNLTPFTTYHYRLVAIRADGKGFPRYGLDRTYTPSPTMTPSVIDSSSSNPEPTAITFSAVINPNQSRTVYRFQYGTNDSYGFQTPTSESIGEDGTEHSVSSIVEGLKPATTYHYRVVAINFNGVTRGPDQTFNTPDAPLIAAESASNVSQTSVTLGAIVHPNFRSTTFHFEYGRTSTYTASTPEAGPIGSDKGAYPVSASIGGLRAGATYHYRAVATNVIGTTDGPDQTFTTAPASNVTPPPPGCKPGYVLRNGKCVKKKRHHKSRHHKRKHHRRSHR